MRRLLEVGKLLLVVVVAIVTSLVTIQWCGHSRDQAKDRERTIKGATATGMDFSQHPKLVLASFPIIRTETIQFSSRDLSLERRNLTILVRKLFGGIVNPARAQISSTTTTYPHYNGCYYFVDVPCWDSAAHFIGYLVESGVTYGCSWNKFCPGDFVTRKQMAVFLGRQAVAEEIINWMIVDYFYTDGLYFFEQAYQDGDITWEDYQFNLAVLNWALGRMDYISGGSLSGVRSLMPRFDE